MSIAPSRFGLLLIAACIAGCDGTDETSLDAFGSADTTMDARLEDLRRDEAPADNPADRPAPNDPGRDPAPDEDAPDDVDVPGPDDPGMTDPGEDTPDFVDVSGSDDPGMTDPDFGPDVPAAPVPFSCSSGTVQDGWNENWTVAGKKRSFYARFPTNPGTRPLAVVFVYHGQGDNVDSFRKFFGPNPDADADFPFVLVYPKSLALIPYGADGGIEWDIFGSNPGDGNVDAAFFEEILGCLDDTAPIDTGSVFVLGFSAGAIFTNLLHARYPDLLRSVFSMSGAWFNDATTVSQVNTFGMATLDWAALTDTQGTVFMTHGGKDDTYGSMGITIIDFEKAGQNAIPHLTGKGRTVIDCPHSAGHTNHPQIAIASMIRFFKDHRGGGPSPYLVDGLPGVVPSTCTVIAP